MAGSLKRGVPSGNSFIVGEGIEESYGKLLSPEFDRCRYREPVFALGDGHRSPDVVMTGGSVRRGRGEAP